MTRVFDSLKEWQSERDDIKNTIGFVPTMGALHSGHTSLIERSIQENSVTVVSIFVNPTQFNDPKDLEKYPHSLKKDLGLLNQWKVDYLVLPDQKQMYPDNYNFRISESEISKILCGEFRPGHFDGVMTVVMKLLNLVRPARAYFGQKDYQQLKLIEKMVEAFFMPVKIVACPTVREKSGLAMSSRNRLLSEEQVKTGAEFAKILRHSRNCRDATDKLNQYGFQVEYIEDHWQRRLAAVRLGNVRLIDNVEI